VTPSRPPAATLDLVAGASERAARAIGLTEGPVHAEVRVHDAALGHRASAGPAIGRGGSSEARVWVIEVAARSIGGLCGRTLRFGAGISLEEVILRHAVGLPLDGLARETAAAGVMMLPITRRGTLVEVRGRDDALAVPGVVGLEITIPPGREVVPLPEGDRYLGFLFARGDTPAIVEQTLRAAAPRIDMVVT
jgi:hypothetical protein